jgi:hypothetical protein
MQGGYGYEPINWESGDTGSGMIQISSTLPAQQTYKPTYEMVFEEDMKVVLQKHRSGLKFEKRDDQETYRWVRRI